MTIQQSGQVTPGHLALWTTDNVLQDGGPFPGTSERVLARLLSASFNTTNDQQIALPSTVTSFQLTRIIVTNANISLTTAVGGFYPDVGKAGTAIVANTQVYSVLTASSKLLNPTLSSFANTTKFNSANLTAYSIFFALSTPQGVPATADIYLVGIDLTPGT